MSALLKPIQGERTLYSSRRIENSREWHLECCTILSVAFASSAFARLGLKELLTALAARCAGPVLVCGILSQDRGGKARGDQ